MKDRSMGILDREPGYVRRLAEYITSKEGCRLRLFTFDNEQEASSYLENERLDILLVGQTVADEAMKDWKSVGQLIVLSEELHPKASDSSSVYKFQASDGLLREVMDCYAKQSGDQDILPENGGNGEIIGVYSPVKRCGKTIFSFVLASVLAEQCRCLLISLDEFCIIDELRPKENEKDLADVMFLYRQNSMESFRDMNVFSRLHGLEYIPPVSFPWDLRQIRTEELSGLVRWAVTEGGYEKVVLDIGEGGDSPLELLDVCGQVYMPEREDPVSQEKIHSFENYMKVSGQQQILDKIEKVSLPTVKLETKTAGAESLLWSPMEKFSRKIAGVSE